MKFYEIDGALHEAIQEREKPVRLKIEIQVQGHFESVFERDIIEANFYGLKEAAGGTSSRGEIIIKNEKLPMSKEVIKPGSEVRVSFSLGDGLPYFQRFRFYIDDKGIQDILGPGRKRRVLIGLRDLSYKLRKTDEARDWISPAVFTYSAVCDKTQPEKSLVHGIAGRAGLTVTDIDCSTIPVTLPYVKLKQDIWLELSSLATTYRCHLECPVEKPLVFAHSPYQINEKFEMRNEENSDEPYSIWGDEIFYLRKIDRAELYKNSVRLKINMPLSLEKQEIWHYDESPLIYDDFLQPHYPFKYPLTREIEKGKYEANYRIIDADGKERNVIFADQIDSKEEAENRLEYDGGHFSYSHYDVSSNYDKAVVTLQKDNDGDLYKASIHGRPIVLDLNRSCFITDNEAAETYGTAALNITGSYFSDYEVHSGNKTVPQYEDWVMRELAERLQQRREFTVKTHKALFNARVGARIQITMNKEQLIGVINAFMFRYRKERAFVASFRITEGNEQGTMSK